jgi:hypothetical protein
MTLHVAFDVTGINELLSAPRQLKARGIMPLSFFGRVDGTQYNTKLYSSPTKRKA